MTSSVFNQNQAKKSHLERDMFLDGNVDIARYDTVRYKQFSEFTDKMLGWFWRPEETDLSKDSNDFKHNLSDHERHIFTSNLKRQILLDSVQGRGPVEAFMPLVSLPELEFMTLVWGFTEQIHSYSYTWIIRNIFPNPDEIFSEITSIEEIAMCAEDISRDYDALINAGKYYDILGEGVHDINGKEVEISKFELKRLIWRALMSCSALESVRFHVSFVTSWLPAETRKVMEGNAKIIKMICRDENLHMAAVQLMLRMLPKDDPDFAKIRDEEEEYSTKIFLDAVQQEKDWAKYLFQHGSVVGLNESMLVEYLDWLAVKRMRSVNLQPPFSTSKANPLPWTKKWISGMDVQVAPQETEITSYVNAGTKQDVDKDTFKDFEL